MPTNYTIRMSGDSMAEVADVALRMAEEPESRPPGTGWNLTNKDHEHQMQVLISGVTKKEHLRTALRGAASELEKGVRNTAFSPTNGLWVQLQPIT